MRALLLQNVFPNGGFTKLIQRQFVRNTEYCEKFGMDYMFHSTEQVQPGGWQKVYLAKELVDRRHYDLIVWLDADAMLCDTSQDVRSVPVPEDSIGVVMFGNPVPHFNVGVFYVRTGKRMEKFFKKWVDGFPGPGAWREQAVFQMIKDDSVVSLPTTWNRNYDNNPSANPVVMGFHGFGSPEERLALMEKVLSHGTNTKGSEIR